MSVNDNWRVLICDTSTGVIQADAEPTTYPGFTRQLNDLGSFNIPVLVNSPENASVDFHSYVSAQYSWIIAYGDYIAQAGPVWQYDFDDTTRILTVQGTGIGGIFSRRVTRNPNGTIAIVDPSQDLTYTNLSLRAIAANLVSSNMQQQYASLPITVSDLTETGTESMTYYGYDLKNVSDNLTALANMDSGPEFDFAPQFTTSTQTAVEWVLNLGNPSLGNQSSTGAWDYGGSLTSIAVDVNATVSPVSRVWVKGSGSDRALLTGFAQDLTSAENGYPMLDYVDTQYTSYSVQTQLDGWAAADLAAYSAAMETWTCAVRIDGALTNYYGTGTQVAPALGDFQVGDAPLFFVDGHMWIPNGVYRRRILGFSSNDNWTVNLSLFDTLATS